ncbi:hypothetical protein QVA66_09520 [Staphylococcus chromogenes]|nr:hypothetical protein [Staphylococcus chromogenes]
MFRLSSAFAYCAVIAGMIVLCAAIAGQMSWTAAAWLGNGCALFALFNVAIAADPRRDVLNLDY